MLHGDFDGNGYLDFVVLGGSNIGEDQFTSDIYFFDKKSLVSLQAMVGKLELFKLDDPQRKYYPSYKGIVGLTIRDEKMETIMFYNKKRMKFVNAIYIHPNGTAQDLD